LKIALGGRAPSTDPGGNDKGNGEGLAGFVRRNFMTPLPVADIRLLDARGKRRQAIFRGHAGSIAERMQADLAAFIWRHS
jgi:hypothetical protein